MKAWIWKQSKRLQEEEGFVEKGLLMMACQCQTMRLQMKWVRIIDVCCLVCQNGPSKIKNQQIIYFQPTCFDGFHSCMIAIILMVRPTTLLEKSSSWIDFLVVKQKTKKFYANVGRQMLKSKTKREFSSLSSFQRELFGIFLCRCFLPKQIEWRCVTFWIGKWAPTKSSTEDFNVAAQKFLIMRALPKHVWDLFRHTEVCKTFLSFSKHALTDTAVVVLHWFGGSRPKSLHPAAAYACVVVGFKMLMVEEEMQQNWGVHYYCMPSYEVDGHH